MVSRCTLEQGRLYPLCTKSVVTGRVLIYCGGKEPLKFWMEALLFKVASVNELTARIIDAFLGMATILLILFVGGALLGWETWVLAALMVLAFPPIILSHCFRAGTQDSLLVFSYTGAVMGYLWYRTKGSRVSLCLATLAVIAGLMTKDVFLLSVYTSVAVAEAILFSRRKGSQGILPMGFLFFLLVPLVWYFLWLLFAYFSTHGACIKHLIKREFVKPALGKVASWSTHYRGPFFYLKILLKFLGPILFFPVLFFVFSKSRDESTDNTKRATFFLIVSLVYLILISIPAFKMKRYVYPIYPTLSLGLAFFVICTIKMIPSKILKALVASGVGALLAMNLFYISSKITTKTREVPSCKFVKHSQALKGPKVFIIERSSGISLGSHDNFYLSLILFVPHPRYQTHA